MTSQGHPQTIFQRAIKARNLIAAWDAAGDLKTVSLTDALALTLLVRQGWPGRYARVSAKWAGRYAAETDASIAEVMLVASHLATLEGTMEPENVRPLAAVLETFGRDALAEVARQAGPAGLLLG